MIFWFWICNAFKSQDPEAKFRIPGWAAWGGWGDLPPPPQHLDESGAAHDRIWPTVSSGSKEKNVPDFLGAPLRLESLPLQSAWCREGSVLGTRSLWLKNILHQKSPGPEPSHQALFQSCSSYLRWHRGWGMLLVAELKEWLRTHEGIKTLS